MSQGPSVQELVEKDRISEVIHALFTFTDARDWVRVRAYFAPEVTFDMTSLSGGTPVDLTPEQITSAWETGLAPIQAVHHQVGNLSIIRSGNEANASCHGIAYHYRPTASGRNTRVFVGTYDLHLRLTNASWRINFFRFNLKFIDGNLDLEREAAVP